MLRKHLDLEAYRHHPREYLLHLAIKKALHINLPSTEAIIFDSGLTDMKGLIHEGNSSCLTGKYPDAIRSKSANRHSWTRPYYRGEWYEGVYRSSRQRYRDRVERALRHGYRIHWIFYINSTDLRRDAHKDLDQFMVEKYKFGIFDDQTDTLVFGTPIYLDNYQYIVGDNPNITLDDELTPKYIDNQNKWKIKENSEEYYVGAFTINGRKLDMWATWDGTKFVGCERPKENEDLHRFDRSDLESLAEQKQLIRKEPIGGRRPRT